MTVPAVPGAGFVVVEAELVFGGLEPLFDPPARTFDLEGSKNPLVLVEGAKNR